jgi:hypothetical protein
VIVLYAIAVFAGLVLAATLAGALIGAAIALVIRAYAWVAGLYSDEEVHP